VNETLHLIDASIYVFRGYFSLPASFTDQGGQPVNAVHGYTSFLLDLLEHKPEFVACAFDESLNSSFRNDIFPAYKANRESPDDNLLYQFQQCQRITQLLGIRQYASPLYEADDFIGSLTMTWRQLIPNTGRVVILTRDKDLGQLLEPYDELWDFAADTRAGPDAVRNKFGVRVDQLADFLALAGDAVDNIPGAPGIGAKTAANLLQRFDSLGELLARTTEVEQSDLRGAKKIAATLVGHKRQLQMYRQITGIKCDIPLALEVPDLRLGPVDSAALAAFADQMQLRAPMRRRLLQQGARS